MIKEAYEAGSNFAKNQIAARSKTQARKAAFKEKYKNYPTATFENTYGNQFSDPKKQKNYETAARKWQSWEQSPKRWKEAGNVDNPLGQGHHPLDEEMYQKLRDAGKGSKRDLERQARRK